MSVCLRSGLQLIEGQIEFENVDTGFTEKSKLPTFRVLIDKLPDLCGADAAQAGDAVELVERGCNADVRI